jgi:hypothetical protein
MTIPAQFDAKTIEENGMRTGWKIIISLRARP